ncbi:hypothetical protein ALP78_101682 [Pseudomonas coronafaciens pv. striafaciens]|uniref:Uncharacterized protein n=1 Tax=Pseudomonas coronafaciens pv. striafaciens TaxID=235276 RepID=A0A3M4YUR7_9PSED|nr:hypothetical protein ALP78_101682 [Pseudomonas coronafaciens pv. striafaciens]
MVEQLSPNALACVRWADIDGLYFRDAAVFGMFPVSPRGHPAQDPI